MIRQPNTLLRRAYTAPILMAAIVALQPAHSCAADIPDESAPLIAVADFNGDGIADVVKINREDAGSHSVVISLGHADGTFGRVPSHDLVEDDPRALVVADLNGDGHPDVIVGDADGALLEFLGDGKGNLAPAEKIATLGSIVSIAVGHFTRNRSLDLVVSDVDSNSAQILLNSGNGSFHQAWSFSLPRKGVEFRIATADFNRDGIADLLIAGDEENTYVVMLGNGNGTFTYAPKLSHLKDPNSYCPT